jgi:phage I-like protein
MATLDGVKQPMGFMIDLLGMQFEDAEKSTWLQAMPLGTYQHPLYGEINASPDKVANIVKNFQDGVRKQELDVDYDHKAHSGKAAGWVKDAQDRGADGLWIQVEWTDDAYKSLGAKEYRYFSPEYADEWTDPSTEVSYTDVLFGGAITNRPFLKDILPINLSEVIRANEQEHVMDRAVLERIAKRLGVEFNEETTDEQLAALIADSDVPTPEPEGEPETEGEQEEEGEPETESESVMASESSVIKLSDGSTTTVGAILKRVATVETANKLAEANAKLTKLNADPNRVLSPACSKRLSDILVVAPKKLGDQVYDLIQSVLKDGVVELGERGGADPTRTMQESAAQQFSTLVSKVQSESKDGNYADAVEKVSRENPDLYEAYRRESFLEVTN